MILFGCICGCVLCVDWCLYTFISVLVVGAIVCLLDLLILWFDCC